MWWQNIRRCLRNKVLMGGLASGHLGTFSLRLFSHEAQLFCAMAEHGGSILCSHILYNLKMYCKSACTTRLAHMWLISKLQSGTDVLRLQNHHGATNWDWPTECSDCGGKCIGIDAGIFPKTRKCYQICHFWQFKFTEGVWKVARPGNTVTVLASPTADTPL